MENSSQSEIKPPAPLAPAPASGFWPQGWWKLMETRIGVIPLPVFVVLIGVVGYFTVVGKLPPEISMMMGVMALFGFACGEAGKHLPVLRHLGAAAIFATFIPSLMVYKHWLPAEVTRTVTDFTKSTGFLYLFIAAIIVGSIWGMDRRMLIQGFFKIVIPTAAGTVLAAIVGTSVGAAFGMGVHHTFFYVVIPIMAGGVGEGAIPLSTGYADILHKGQGDVFAQVLPPVMFGSLIAILLAGVLNFIGKKYPALTGEGRLQPGEHDDMDPQQQEISPHMDVGHIAAAGMTVLSLYLVGLVIYRVGSAHGWSLPAPLTMLVLAVAIKLSRAVSPKLQEGSYVVYRFFATAVTYPLLFAIGVAMTPWETLIAAFALPNLVTIASTVITMVVTGFVTARWIKLYPVDMAIVNSCRCAQGGTGNVAILTACDRMQLMPFAQVATRIGGAATVFFALLAYGRMH